MKPMEYDDSGVTRLLHVEECNGEQIVVLNVRGSHPCAYVSVSGDIPDKFKDDKCAYDYFYVDDEDTYVHGGFTYSNCGKPFDSDEIRNSFWLGWDYAHLHDLIAWDLHGPRRLTLGKAWTTEEIVDEARKVAGNVVYDLP